MKVGVMRSESDKGLTWQFAHENRDPKPQDDFLARFAARKNGVGQGSCFFFKDFWSVIPKFVHGCLCTMEAK